MAQTNAIMRTAIERARELAQLPAAAISMKEHYDSFGYVVVPKLFSKEQLRVYEQRFEDICELGANVPLSMVLMRDVSILKTNKRGARHVNKLTNFNDDPVLFEYARDNKIISVLQKLIGTPGKENATTMVSMNSMLINKPPDNGTLTSRHPMHQDMQYFPFGPHNYICCSWTAMEKVDRSNGCLAVLPGTHTMPLLPHGYPKWEGGVNRTYYSILDYDATTPRVHIELEAGDTIFFNPNLIHGSGANRSQRFRKAISIHFANDDMCEYTETDLSPTQRKAEEEVLKLYKHRYFAYGIKDPNLMKTLADYWRLRCRGANGEARRLGWNGPRETNSGS